MTKHAEKQNYEERKNKIPTRISEIELDQRLYVFKTVEDTDGHVTMADCHSGTHLAFCD